MLLGKGGSLKNSYFWWREELRRDSVVVWFMDRQGVGMWVWVIMGMMRESQYLHNIPQPNLTLKQPGLYWVSAWKKLSTYPSRVQSFVSIKSKWKWPDSVTLIQSNVIRKSLQIIHQSVSLLGNLWTLVKA